MQAFVFPLTRAALALVLRTDVQVVAAVLVALWAVRLRFLTQAIARDVPHVVAVGALVQVIDVHAGLVVALVQDVLALTDGADLLLPGPAMRATVGAPEGLDAIAGGVDVA